MSRAFDLLTAACRVWLGTGPAGLAVGADVDRDELAELAFVHNLEPLLFRLGERRRVDLRAAPAELRERWEQAYFQNHVFNTEAIELLVRLADAAEREDLAVAVFKGPATLARGYSDPGLRPMVDLDLLCRECDLSTLVRIARDLGFAGVEENAVYHVTLTHPGLALGLELHFDLYDFLPRRRELLERLLAGVVRVELGGYAFPAPRPETAMLLDVAHLVNHDFGAGLKPLLDLAAQARRAAEPPPAEAVSREAERFGLEPELELAAALVERLFAARLPVGRSDPGTDLLAEVARLETALRRPSPARPALGEPRARPGLAAKARYLARLLFPPQDRLAAAGGDAGALTLRRRHLATRLRSALARRRAWGTAAAETAGSSIKRRVYERRGR